MHIQTLKVLCCCGAKERKALYLPVENSSRTIGWNNEEGKKTSFPGVFFFHARQRTLRPPAAVVELHFFLPFFSNIFRIPPISWSWEGTSAHAALDKPSALSHGRTHQNRGTHSQDTYFVVFPRATSEHEVILVISHARAAPKHAFTCLYVRFFIHGTS